MVARWWHDTAAEQSVVQNAKGEEPVALRWSYRNRRRALNLAAGLILLAGLAGATLVYWTSAPLPSVLSIDQGTGTPAASVSAYSVQPRDSKQYVSDVQNVGGLAAVLSDDFHWWLADLWHGKALAITLATLASAAALACVTASRLLYGSATEGTDGQT